MGCCFSSEEDKDLGHHDPDERTRLLDPTLGSSTSSSLGHQSQEYTRENEKGDEQSVMARILHENARDVIDVASNETTPIEQREYHDRAKQYSTRSKMLLSNSAKRGLFKMALPNGITTPQTVLAAPPVSPAEVQLICITSDKFSKAMKDVCIQHREDLVVSFGVPMP